MALTPAVARSPQYQALRVQSSVVAPLKSLQRKTACLVLDAVMMVPGAVALLMQLVHGPGSAAAGVQMDRLAVNAYLLFAATLSKSHAMAILVVLRAMHVALKQVFGFAATVMDHCHALEEPNVLHL
jgi:hypothetical protein